MKRSQINQAVSASSSFFRQNGWHLPPNPRWDVTDFGLGDFKNYGLVLVNLAEEEEYCEKLMYAVKGQKTPAHTHNKKKEDIICRTGKLAIQLWHRNPEHSESGTFTLKVNGQNRECTSGELIVLNSGERITLVPGIYHEFYPESAECIIGEVSTANDDEHDNYFVNKEVGRFSSIVEDEPAMVKLVNE